MEQATPVNLCGPHMDPLLGDYMDSQFDK